jgi:hypothetical protein
MADKEDFIALINKAGFVFSEDAPGFVDTVYIKGKWGGADFHFDKETGDLVGGGVIGDQCEFYKAK